MKRFKEFKAELERNKAIEKLTLMLEHEVYKRIPGTANSYRQDASNTNTQSQRHTHVYAKLNGGGKELYSVNTSGSGHDGSSGTEIPSTHANFFRSKGYDIPLNNILESLSLEQISDGPYRLFLLEDT